MNELQIDLALFIWYVMKDFVFAAVATATVFTFVTAIASFFNFLATKRGVK